LRERTGDIPDLVAHFLDLISRREGRQAPKIDRAAMALLQQYSWPGNVRELQNLCQRGAALVTDGVVTAAVIESWISPAFRQPAEFTNLRDGRLLEDAERQLIEKTLGRHNGHRAKTAKALGIGVRTLGMKLKQWREEAEASRRTAELTGVL
jgi:DNA-binding NtrC family response regulator